MTTEKLALADLRGSSQFFLKFLGTIGVLMTAHYPILPEAMVTVYRGDSVGARMLTTALTIIGFAAIVAVVSIPRTTFCRFKHQKISTKAALLWCSTVLLMICAFGLAASFTLANISARIANAVSAAELRAPFDRAARDFLSEIRDESTTPFRSYRLATEYVQLEGVRERSVQDVLVSTSTGSLRGSIVVTYVFTIVCFKVGLFALASYIYIHSRLGRKRKQSERSQIPATQGPRVGQPQLPDLRSN